MKKVLIILVFGMLYSCTQIKKEVVILSDNKLQEDRVEPIEMLITPSKIVSCDSLDSGLNYTIKTNYVSLKQKQVKLRKRLKEEFLKCPIVNRNSFLDSISNIFSVNLLNDIIPHWYGTTWDFEGHTSVPNQGEIACGYFVSTTIRDMGLNINRYHLARQNPENEARTLAIKDSLVIEIRNNDSNLFFTEIAGLKTGLYFIGLDNHVGYFYKTEHCNYFIHSNYIENRVMIENGIISEAFDSYEYYMTNITGNKLLMYYWLFEKQVEVIKV